MLAILCTAHLVSSCGNETGEPNEAAEDLASTTTNECGQEGVPWIHSVEARRSDETGEIAVRIQGNVCESSPKHFSFGLHDAAGEDIYGRFWPEVDHITAHADGAFSLQGVATGCSSLDEGVTISIFFANDLGQSNVATVEIQ